MSIMDNVREYDPEAGERSRRNVRLRNLLDIDDRGIQLLFARSSPTSLIIAPKGASPELRESVQNMSQRAAEMLREDLESKGPAHFRGRRANQKEILKIARRLADEGQLVLGGGGSGRPIQATPRTAALPERER